MVYYMLCVAIDLNMQKHSYGPLNSLSTASDMTLNNLYSRNMDTSRSVHCLRLTRAWKKMEDKAPTVQHAALATPRANTNVGMSF